MFLPFAFTHCVNLLLLASFFEKTYLLSSSPKKRAKAGQLHTFASSWWGFRMNLLASPWGICSCLKKKLKMAKKCPGEMDTFGIA